MALFNSDIEVNVHEVSLKNKPRAMLDLSSKGTVPVLLVDDNVIDESLDIILWALAKNDPDNWCSQYSETEKQYAMQLIRQNEEEFKAWLDKYKYADRHTEFSQEYYRQNCENFLQILETTLQSNTHLMSENITLADIAIFPFIRQFAMVDKNWFDHCIYPAVRYWLNSFLDSALFIRVMAKTAETKIH